MIVTVYGEGGYCENCDLSHPHPLNNIIEHYELPDPEPTPEELARQSAVEKLQKLGLTDDEILALLSK